MKEVVPVSRKIPMRRIHIVIGCAIVLVAIAAILGWKFVDSWGQQQIMSDRYQAVYLTTGQIYFGKLQNTQGDFLTLKNPYTTEGQSNADKSTQGETKLIKGTQQVYGPDDSIALRSSQVRFWQNLRLDSKITQAIESAK